MLFWEIALILILVLFLVIEIYSNKIKSTNEFETVQSQITEVKQFFKDFSFVTLYRENSNRGFIDIPSNPNIISNNDYDAVNKFIRYVKKILNNNLTSTHRGPLSNDSFNLCFPPGPLKLSMTSSIFSINQLKRLFLLIISICINKKTKI